MKCIKLDIDERRIDWKRIRTVIQFFKLKINLDMSWIAKTKKGFHIYLFISNSDELKVTDEDLCFIQCAMGDDYKRSCLNWKRVTIGHDWQKKNWNVLFNMKIHSDLKGHSKIASMEKPLGNIQLKRRLGNVKL